MKRLRRGLRGRLLSVLPRLGLEVVDVGPGTVVVSRRHPAVQVRELSPGATLCVHGPRVRRNVADFQKALYRFLTPEHVAWMLRLYRVNCVVDAGANVGQFGLALRRAGYRGRIASFEPLPHLLERLEPVARADPDWRVFPVALGSDDAEMPMHVVSGTMSSLLPPSEFGSSRYKRFRAMEAQRVPVRRLDGMLDEVLDGVPDPRPYLKLDTQGFDLEVFRGLGDRSAEFVGMQSEVALVRIYEGMPHLTQMLDVSERAGFQVTGMFPVSREDRTARVLEFDCVMVRPDASRPAGR